MPRTTCRLSLRLRDSRTSSRTRNEPTTITNLAPLSGGPEATVVRWRSPPAPRSTGLEGPHHLVDAVGLDDVAYLDVVVVGDLDAAVEALPDLADVVLVVLQRLQAGGPLGRREDDHPLADDADLGRPLDGALGDVAAGHRSDLADLKRLPDH